MQVLYQLAPDMGKERLSFGSGEWIGTDPAISGHGGLWSAGDGQACQGDLQCEDQMDTQAAAARPVLTGMHRQGKKPQGSGEKPIFHILHHDYT